MADPVFFQGGPLSGTVWVPGGENREQVRVVIDDEELCYVAAHRCTPFGELVYIFDQTGV